MPQHHGHHRLLHGVVEAVAVFSSGPALALAALGAFAGAFGGHLLLDAVRAEIGGHDDNRVTEVHSAAVAVGEAAVIHHLQQDVEHIRVGLLHLVQQQHRIGAAAHRLGEITPLLVAHIAGGRADEAGHGMTLHKLGHVHPQHGRRGVEQELGQSLAQLGLAHASGPEK